MEQDEEFEDVNHKLVEQQANILGPELWDLLSNVVGLIWRPSDMHQYGPWPWVPGLRCRRMMVPRV